MSDFIGFEYKARKVLFREGDPSDCMYDIQSGKVGIYAAYGTADEKLLTELSAGDFFGEMGMIENKPRSATAVVLENASIVRVDRDQLKGFLKVRPDCVLAVMRHMSSRLRQLSTSYLSVCLAVDKYQKAVAENPNMSEADALLEKYALEYQVHKSYDAKE